jgi:hypothetical protein
MREKLVEKLPSGPKFDPMVGFLCADLGEIWPVWKKSAYFGNSSAKIGGGN